MMKIGFYYNCYKNRFATDNILKQTRIHYPNNPIFLMCDNGDDLSDLADKYNCKYYYSNINVLGGRIINDKKCHCFTDELCAKEFLKVILLALDYCNSDYIILLEDDVFVNGKVNDFPIHSGGYSGFNYYKHQMINNDDSPLYKKYPNIKYNYWNLAGGSIINSKVLKQCIENTDFEEIKFFDTICKSEFQLWHSNDLILSYILMINGFTTEPWTGTSRSNIIHPDKRFYNENLTESAGVYRK
jgi:hypothetical protein